MCYTYAIQFNYFELRKSINIGIDQVLSVSYPKPYVHYEMYSLLHLPLGCHFIVGRPRTTPWWLLSVRFKYKPGYKPCDLL